MILMMEGLKAMDLVCYALTILKFRAFLHLKNIAHAAHPFPGKDIILTIARKDDQQADQLIWSQ